VNAAHYPHSAIPPRVWVLTTLLALTLVSPAALRAQAVAPAPTASAAKTKSATDSAEVFKLNPFEVKSEADNSYGALNSNSLTQFDAALKNVPVPADIFTEDFMCDVAVTNLEDLMLSHGAGTVMSNPESDALSQQPGDRVGNQTLRLLEPGERHECF
jgi:outer membrane receptor for ferric coprogen and ferric-rhodotorulic acid